MSDLILWALLFVLSASVGFFVGRESVRTMRDEADRKLRRAEELDALGNDLMRKVLDYKQSADKAMSGLKELQAKLQAMRTP